jgi:hypothetical protein
MHVAPIIGTGKSVTDQYQLQWLTLFEGYVVDAFEGLALILACVAHAGDANLACQGNSRANRDLHPRGVSDTLLVPVRLPRSCVYRSALRDQRRPLRLAHYLPLDCVPRCAPCGTRSLVCAAGDLVTWGWFI